MSNQELGLLVAIGVRVHSDIKTRVLANHLNIAAIEQRERELTEFARAWILRDQLDREVGQAGKRKGGRL